MRDLSQYPFNIRPLSKDEGGGFLISFPDFSDCISDGDTPEEAIRNGMDALRETIAALEEFCFPVPNKTTKNALQDAQARRNLATFNTLDDLFEDLEI